MDTKWLEDFLVLAEVGNFTRAAEMRNVSQAAFSRRIKSLEQEVNTILVDRASYPAVLTPEGKALADTAAKILRDLRDTAQDLSTGTGGMLRIGIPYALATGHGGGWMSDWTSQRLRYRLDTGNAHDLFTALASGLTDVLITYHSTLHPIHLDIGKYDRLVLGGERLSPYCRAGLAGDLLWPGSLRRPVPLLNYPPTTYFGRVVQELLTRVPQRFFSRLAAECEMADVLAGLTQSGAGVAWLPARTAGRLSGHPLEIVADGEWSAPLEIVAFRAKNRTGKTLHLFWENLISYAKSQTS